MPFKFYAIGARAFAMAGSFCQVVVVSRALNLDDAGRVFLLFTLMTLAATLGRFGTDNLAMRRIAAGQTGYESEARWLTGTCWITSCVAGAALFLLLWAGGMPFAGGHISALEAATVGVMSVVYSLGVFAGAVLRGAGRLVAGILAELGIAPWLTVASVIWLSAMGEATVLTVLWALLVSGGITAAWALGAARRSVPWVGAPEWRNGCTFIRRQLSSLVPLMGTSLLFFALVWVPQLALGFVGTGAQVAQYTAAARIASFIGIFPSVQTSYLGPKFAALAFSGNHVELSRACGRAAIAAMVVAVPLLAVVSELPYCILGLFGDGYGPSAIPVLFLCIGAYLTLAFGQVNTVMLTSGLERIALGLNAVLLLIVAFATLLGAPFIGVIGVSVVSATASLLYALAASVIIQVRMNVNTTVGSYFMCLFVREPQIARLRNE